MIIYNGNYCVYLHTNIINGKKYVGITCQEPNKRWKNRTGYNPRGKGKSKFYNAILKYGWNNFEHEIVASNLTREEANNFEHILIISLKTNNSEYGYNITDGGDGWTRIKHTEKTKQKISESNKGKIAWNKGKPLTEEQKEKLRISHLGKKCSTETKNKMSVARKNKPNLHQRKKVLNEETKEVFDSLTQAAFAYNVSIQAIHQAIKTNKTSKGFHWKYYEESEGLV